MLRLCGDTLSGAGRARGVAEWKGCGHSVEAMILDGNPLSIIPYLEFRENNPDELCWECWLKKRGRRR